jgi:hypothetical protein
MAKQTIGIGVSANDGLGDPLRTAFTKVNSNSNELYNIGGWAFYSDDETTTLTIGTTPSKFTINKLGASTYDDKLPLPIRGISSLWDDNSFIRPINIDDCYDFRINALVNSRTSNPAYLILTLDIGGGATPTNVIFQKRIPVDGTTPFVIGDNIPIFCRATFLANGGQIFMSTNTGSLTITQRAVYLIRTFSEA